jgi:hypothetical protein
MLLGLLAFSRLVLLTVLRNLGAIPRQKSVAAQPGTSIAVFRLFSRFPVRRQTLTASAKVGQKNRPFFFFN